MTPQPVHIASAAVQAQVLVIVVLFIGALTIQRAARTWRLYRQQVTYYSFGWIVLSFTVLSLLLVVFSDAFVATSRPVLSGIVTPTIPYAAAIFLAFCSDILCITLLVARTGGTQASPFTALYSLIPVLAILLREPVGRFVTYTSLLLLSYSVLLFNPPRSDTYEDDRAWFRLTYWIVGVLAAAIAVYIGWFTRPL
mgnify:CR=1 FL=1